MLLDKRSGGLFQVKGLDSVISNLEALEKDIRTKLVKKPVYKLVNDMKKQVELNIPVDTGNLLDNLKTRKRSRASQGFVVGDVYFNRGKSREDGAYYAHMVEYGHRIVPFGNDTGRSTQPASFFRNAQIKVYGMKGEVAFPYCQMVIRKGIEKHYKKMARYNKKGRL